MDAKHIHERLQSFGLEEGEARLYFHLVQGGAQSASELAMRAHTHRTDVYRLAKSLVSKGFAQRTLERPVRFTPLPLESVLEDRARRVEQEAEQMRSDAQRLAAAWPQSEDMRAPPGRFVVHQGAKQVRQLLAGMLRRPDTVLCAPAPLLERLDVASAAGARVSGQPHGGRSHHGLPHDERGHARILTVGRMGALGRVPRDAEIRTARGAVQPMAVAGDEVALLVGTEPKEEAVLWIHAPHYARTQRSLFERAWEEAGARRVVPRTGPEAAYQALVDLIATSSSGVVVHCTWQEWEDWCERGLPERLERTGPARFLVSGAPAGPLPDPVLPSNEVWPLSAAANAAGALLVIRSRTDDVWSLRVDLPETGLWVFHLLRSALDEAQMVERTS